MSDDIKTLRGSLARIVGGEIEGLALLGSHTYTVRAVYAGGRCDLEPKEERMPLLAKVDQWLGSGEVATPIVGSECCVEFRDLKKDRPMITRWQPQRLAGGIPTKVATDAATIELGGAGAQPLAFFAAFSTFASGVVSACAANTPPITVAPLSGGATTKVKGV